MKTTSSKQFYALFALHVIIACILPFLSVVLGPDVPIYWWLSILIFIIVIPWEGFILMVPNPKSNLSKVCLNSMYFQITMYVLFWAVCAYGVWESNWPNFKYMYWWTILAAFGTTYRHRNLLTKYIEQFKLSDE
ncbi:MAG TPA: hypothetical protein PLX77_02505 [Candidatus Cloacimonadota bacterium]|nr:hypothetical protein [Candidatus Cloacimonadota bacterium]